MKILLSLILATIFSFSVFSQISAPQLDVKALALDNKGKVRANEDVSFYLNLFGSEGTSHVIYSELHKVSSDSSGTLEFILGNGKQVEGIFPNVQDANKDFFMSFSFSGPNNSHSNHPENGKILFLPYALDSGKSYVLHTIKKSKESSYLKSATSNPLIALDLSNIARLTPTTITDLCDAGIRGALYFDSQLNEFCYCNGLSWKQVDGGGDCNATLLKNNKSNSSTNPTIALELTSIMRVTPSDFQDVCDPGLAGSLFFDASINEFCYCDGAAWKQLDGDGDCGCADNDSDGYDRCDATHPNDTDGFEADCDDNDLNIFPGNTELCNGIDDDCDGSVDEGFVTLGSPCTVGIGACQRNGFIVCNPDGSGVECNVSVGPPSSELCNGIDDDCDGSVDEDFVTLGSPCTVGIGACQRNGFIVCNPDGSGVECNVSVGPPSSELCNGIDDDCDGSVDEDFVTLGSPCTVGIGACQRNGFIVCNPDGSGVECNVSVGPPSSELCNGIDDDCDGSVDEDFVTLGSPCTVGIGACQRNGFIVCNPDGSGVECNVSVGPPSSELCNGIDDDCDGSVDEDFVTLGQTCFVGVGECQRLGYYVCRPDGTGVECSASPGNSGTETCDGLDNDCDGVVDNRLNPPLNPLQSGVCFGSTQTCTGFGSWSEDYSNVADYELFEISCDGLDNDCDGIIDEGCP